VKALHLNRSSLYATFGDKHALFLEALRLYSERVVSRTADTLDRAPTPLAGVQALFDELAASAETPAGSLGCFVVNSVAELVPYDAAVSEIAAGYNAAMQRLLAAAVAGSPAAERQPPEQLAAYLFNAVQGLRVVIKSGASRAQAQAIAALTLAQLR